MLSIGKDWPVYLLVGVALCFFIYVGYRNHKTDKEKKDIK